MLEKQSEINSWGWMRGDQNQRIKWGGEVRGAWEKIEAETAKIKGHCGEKYGILMQWNCPKIYVLI